MQTQTTHSRQRLQDLSKDTLISLLRSTYEYKSFVNYHDEHNLKFLDKYEQTYGLGSRKVSSQKQKQLSQSEIMKQLQSINKQNGLNLHNYHLELIFGKFKSYYDRYEQHKSHKIKAEYEKKIRKVQKEGESTLPEDLMEICLEKEKTLTQQLKNRKNPSIKL